MSLFYLKPIILMDELRNCLKNSIPEIYEAAKLLDAAIDAHLYGDIYSAENLIKKADINEIRKWTESIWGVGGIYSEMKKKYRRT
jgi:hypothetical protein